MLRKLEIKTFCTGDCQFWSSSATESAGFCFHLKINVNVNIQIFVTLFSGGERGVNVFAKGVVFN